MLQSQSERVSVGLHLAHQELVLSTDGQSTCAADPQRPLPVSGMGLESIQWEQETAGFGSQVPWRLWESEGAGRTEWKRLTMEEKGRCRVSHSRGIEVSWSLRHDGLEGLWWKQVGGKEGGAAAGWRTGVLTERAST